MELKQIFHTSSHSTNQTRLLHILVSFAENTRYEPLTETAESTGVSPARILRAKRMLMILCEKSIEELNQVGIQDKVNWRIHCIICCALFGYVTSGRYTCTHLPYISAVPHIAVCLNKYKRFSYFIIMIV